MSSIRVDRWSMVSDVGSSTSCKEVERVNPLLPDTSSVLAY